MVFFLFSCGGGGGNSSQLSNSPLTYSATQLSGMYSNTSTFKAISVPFSKTLSTPTKAKRSSSLVCGGGIEIQQGWISLVDSNGNKIEGIECISPDKKTLSFIPQDFLTENSSFTAILSSTITFSDNSTLAKDITFSIHTSSKPLLDVAYTLTDSTINLTVDPLFAIKSLTAVFDYSDNKTFSNPEEKITISRTFNDYGEHTIKLLAEDSYGRISTKILKITLKKPASQVLKSVLDNVESATPDDIPNDTLKDTLNNYDVNLAIAAERAQSPTISAFNIEKKENNFKVDYIKNLINRGEFVGIAYFSGTPTIISATCSGTVCSLHFVSIQDGISCNINSNNYTVNLNLKPINKALPFVSLDIPGLGSNTINLIKSALGQTFSDSLPVLAIDKTNNQFIVYTRENTKSLSGYIKKTTIKITQEIANTVESALETFYNIISRDTITLLKNAKKNINNLLKIINKNKVGGILNQVNNIKSITSTLGERLSNITQAGSFSEDPDKHLQLIENLMLFGDGNIKDTIKNLLSDIKSASTDRQSQLYVFIQSFFNNSQSASTYFSDFLADTTKESYAIIDTDPSGNITLKLKFGSSTQNISLNYLEQIKNTAQQYGIDISDTPVKALIDNLTLFSFKNIYAGYHFYPDQHKLINFIKKYYSDSVQKNDFQCDRDNATKISCFSSYLSPLKTQILLKNSNEINGAVLSFTTILTPYDFSPINLYNSTIGMLFAPIITLNNLPSIKIIGKFSRGKMEKTITLSTKPDIGVGGSVKAGVDLNYAAGIGGEAQGGLSLGIGLDLSDLSQDLVNDLTEAVNTAILSAMQANNIDGYSLQQQAQNSPIKIIGVFNFSDDKAFIKFVKLFLSKVKQQLENGDYANLTDRLTFFINVGTDVGFSLGLGGTGTGGAAGTLKLGASLEFGFNSTLLVDSFLSYLDSHNIKTCFMSPVMNMITTVNKNNQEAARKSLAKRIKSITNSALIIAKTIEQLDKNQLPNDATLKGIMKSLAKNSYFSFTIPLSVEGKLEGGAESGGAQTSGSTGVGFSWSVNGELLLNTAYYLLKPFISDIDKYKDIFDHAGIYPEDSFSIPLAAELGTSEELAVEAGVSGSVQANFIEFSETFKNDPILSNGVHADNKTFKPDIVVHIKQISNRANNIFALECETYPQGNYTYKWNIDGVDINAENTVIENVVEVQSLRGNTIRFRIDNVSFVVVSCSASDEQNHKASDFIRVKRPNNPPNKPQIKVENYYTINNNIYTTENSGIIISDTDPDGDTLIYTIEISPDKNFSTLFYTTTITSKKFSIGNIPLDKNKTYYMRIKASDGLAYSTYSDIIPFVPMGEFEIISPSNFAIFDIDNIPQIVFDVITPSKDNTTILISKSQTFDNATIVNFDKATGKWIWEPENVGIYYFKAKLVTEEETLYTDPATLTIRPAPPEFTSPSTGKFEHKDGYIEFKLTSRVMPDRYRLFIADNITFSNATEFNSTNGEFKWYKPTIHNPPYKRVYYYRAAVVVNGIESRYTKTKAFLIENSPPDIKFISFKNNKTSYCIRDNITLTINTWDKTDNITKADIELINYDTGLTRFYRNIPLNRSENITQLISVANPGGYGRFKIRVFPYDQYGASIENTYDNETIEKYFSDHLNWQNAAFRVNNCPPTAEPIYPSSRIYAGSPVYLEAKDYDPDGDKITATYFLITYPDNTTHEYQSTNIEGDGTAFYVFTPQTSGSYCFQTKAYSQIKSTNIIQEGSYSSPPQCFVVYDAPIPSNINPPNGALIFDNETGSIKIEAQADFSDNDSHRAIQFLYGYGYDMSTNQILDNNTAAVEADSRGVAIYTIANHPDPSFKVYWRARRSIGGGWSAFYSNTYCFTYLKTGDFTPQVSMPDNLTIIDNSVKFGFTITNRFSNCWDGEKAKIDYMIKRISDNITVDSATNIDSDNFTKTLSSQILPEGSYTLWVRQHYTYHHDITKYSPWVEKTFDVVEENQNNNETLELYYDFNSCTDSTVKDLSDNHMDGYLSEGLSCNNGVVTIDNSTNSYIYLGSCDNPDNLTITNINDFTIIARVKLNGYNQYSNTIFNGSHCDTTNNDIYKNDALTVQIIPDPDNGTQHVFNICLNSPDNGNSQCYKSQPIDNLSLTDGNYHKIAVVRDNDQITIYIDNNPISTLNTNSDTITLTYILIGGYLDSCPAGEPYYSSENLNGSIDYIKFYLYALSAEEISNQ